MGSGVRTDVNHPCGSRWPIGALLGHYLLTEGAAEGAGGGEEQECQAGQRGGGGAAGMGHEAEGAVHPRRGRPMGQRPDQPVVVAASGPVEGLAGAVWRIRDGRLELSPESRLKPLDPAAWEVMDDEAVIVALTGVRGIGRWTAEMFMIFNQLRPDVFPLDDLGLQRAVFERYFEGQKQPRKVLAEFGERWRPWRSVATWYLWRSLDPVPVEY